MLAGASAFVVRSVDEDIEADVGQPGAELTGIIDQIGVSFRMTRANGMATVAAAPGWIGQALRPKGKRIHGGASSLDLISEVPQIP